MVNFKRQVRNKTGTRPHLSPFSCPSKSSKACWHFDLIRFFACARSAKCFWLLASICATFSSPARRHRRDWSLALNGSEKRHCLEPPGNILFYRFLPVVVADVQGRSASNHWRIAHGNGRLKILHQGPGVVADPMNPATFVGLLVPKLWATAAAGRCWFLVQVKICSSCRFTCCSPVW